MSEGPAGGRSLPLRQRPHLTDLMAVYNFPRCLKTLSRLTPYEYVCKIWTSEPDRFSKDPIHQIRD